MTDEIDPIPILRDATMRGDVGVLEAFLEHPEWVHLPLVQDYVGPHFMRRLSVISVATKDYGAITLAMGPSVLLDFGDAAPPTPEKDMPRIVKRQVAELQRECPNCFCLFGYKPSETFGHGFGPRHITCPNCKVDAAVNPKKDKRVELDG